MTRPLLQQRRNCWRLGKADEAFVLVDADDYFQSLYYNLRRATRAVYILAWDLDSRQCLRPGFDSVDGYPTEFRAFLERLLEDKPELTIYVLCWDFSSIYLFGREGFQSIKLGWQTHERLRFRFDSEHPMYASHHQKLVVIDDQLAYCGGLDITGARWDTMRHEPGDPRRTLPTGTPYAPFHDLMIGVTGEPARWFGELCRERWLQATGEVLEPPVVKENPSRFLAPPERFREPQLAVARTVPAFKALSETREVERLFIDMIDAAKRYIYIENQYFTAEVIVAAVKRALQREDGPEIVLVMPKVQDSWLSQHTMGTLTTVAVNAVRRADRHGRLHVYYPDDARLIDQEYINVHAKLMVVDGVFLRVGSANLNNRSMGLDTEADVVIDATDDGRQKLQIERLVAHLVAHHIGMHDTQEVLAAWKRTGSLGAAIESMSGKGSKSLQRFHCPEDLGAIDALLAELDVIDPQRPIPIDRLVDEVVFRDESARERLVGHRIPTGLLLTYAFCAVAVGLRFLPSLAPYLHEEAIRGAIAAAGLPGPALPWYLAGFVLLGLICVPLNLLLVLTASLFPADQALGLAIVGSMVLAVVGYGVGGALHGRLADVVRGRSLTFLQQKIVRRSPFAIFLTRFFPIAPFTLVNLAAGSARVALGPFLGGTLLGVLPGTLAIVAFQRMLRVVIEEPNGNHVALLAGVVAAMTVVFYAISRRVGSAAAVGFRAGYAS